MPEVRDIIRPGLTILFVGFNPGLRSAETGRHFAGPSNRFWKLLAASGLTPRQLRPDEDDELTAHGCGIVNIVDRPTRAAAEITKDEYRRGRELLRQKLLRFRPLVAAYAGIGVYQEFAGVREVACGPQPRPVVEGVADFVLPSPSGLNRMLFADQLRYFAELREFASALGNKAPPPRQD